LRKNGAAFSGALRLDYVDPDLETSGARSASEDSGAAGAATSLVAVIDTVPPPVRGSSVPALGAGELALFIPGLEHRLRSIGQLLSDLSIANAFGVASIADVRLYFSPLGSVASSTVASMGAVAPRGSILLADVVNTVYQNKASSGSLQLRSLQAERLLTGVRLVTVRPGRGTLGTMLPVFRSTRAAKGGEDIRLAGIRRGATEADLLVQETSGAPASVRIEYFDAAGVSVAVVDPVAIEPFGTASYFGSVPDRAATAIVTNRVGSGGRVVAYGRNLDAGMGDLWVVNDWSRLGGFDSSSAQMIVYAPLSGSKEPRRRPVRRGAPATREAEAEAERTTLELTVHNPSLSPAGALVTYYENGVANGPKALSLAARETRTIDDAVGSLFGRRGSSTGWIAIEPRRGASLALSSRVVTKGAAPSTATIPVAALSSGLRLGQTQLFAGIDDARQATIDARLGGTTATTLGFTESAGEDAPVARTVGPF